MKRYFFFILILILTGTFDLWSQSINLISAVEGSYLIPTGSLSERFDPGMGITVKLGQETSKEWKWFGTFEYINLDTENEEQLSVKRNLNVAGIPTSVQVPTPGLQMNFTSYSLSANGENIFLDYTFLKANFEFGFGIYRWESLRGSFRDSIYYDTTGSGTKSGLEFISIAEIKQTDWSGGFNLGIGITIPVIKPIDIYIAGHYKIIIGELWPALVLDKENVSTFQMIDVRLGIRGTF